MNIFIAIVSESWEMLLDAGIYILFGIVAGGLLKTFLSPATVARHLGHGRLLPVLKAALFGIPLPLCSCGVLPAAAALKRQGANRGATTAFLIATPESGVDSISASYALLDPIMTVARPLAALCSAIIAGISENLLHPPKDDFMSNSPPFPQEPGPLGIAPEEKMEVSGFFNKIKEGMAYAFGELWQDLAGWFFLGLLLSGCIAALVPEELIGTYLGGGPGTMLLMLAIGIPLYICATASTPIAAALILKGASPGAALVFLLAGPATNMAGLSVLIGLLGKRSTALYLACIAVTALGAGLLLDWIYQALQIEPQATIGLAGELIPYPLRLAGALAILALSVRPLIRLIGGGSNNGDSCRDSACGCRNDSRAAL